MNSYYYLLNFDRRAFDAFVLEEWENGWEEGVTITMLHPDYPNLFHMSYADEFFHHCLKKFERTRVGVTTGADDSEMTDMIDNEADEEEGGDEKLDLKKKLPEPEYYREPENEDDDDMPMAKLTVKDTKGNF
jgi:hypothetical protein